MIIIASPRFNREAIMSCISSNATVKRAMKDLSFDKFQTILTGAIRETGINKKLQSNNEAYNAFMVIFLEELQKAMQAPTSFNPRIPQTMHITNSRLANQIDSLKVGIEETIVVGGRGNSVPTEIKAMLMTSDDTDILDKITVVNGSKPISKYEKCVHDAICSLIESGNHHLTPAMIYRAVNGMSSAEKVSNTAMKNIIDIVEKFRHLEISIDYKEQLAEYYKEQNIQSAEISEYIFDLKKVTVVAGGKKVTAYEYNSKYMPPVYAYSQQFKQIITIPRELLNTKSVTRNNENVVVLRYYLITRIELMKNKNNLISNRCINYHSIYNEIGLDPESAGYTKSCFAIRKQAQNILSFFVEQKHIKSFSQYKNGKEIEGLKIEI